ncbi:hypothetical protein RFI_33552, partial [Reticulomyxa filosa]
MVRVTLAQTAMNLKSERMFKVQKWMERNLMWYLFFVLCLMSVLIKVSPLMTTATEVDFLGNAIYVPRVAAGVIIACLCFIPLTMSYALLEMLQRIKFVRVFFNIHKQKEFHIMLGWIAVFFAVVHVGAWLLLYQTYADNINKEQYKD